MKRILAAVAGLALAFAICARSVGAQEPDPQKPSMALAQRQADAGLHLTATATALAALAAAPAARWRLVFRCAAALCMEIADLECAVGVLDAALPILTRQDFRAVDATTRGHAVLLHSYLVVASNRSSDRFIASTPTEADALADPVLVANLHLLASQAARQRAELVAARDHLDRAIVVALSIERQPAAALRLIVRCAAQLIDGDEAQRALGLMAAAAPLLVALPPDSLLAWELLQVAARLKGIRRRLDLAVDDLEQSLDILAALQLRPEVRRGLEMQVASELLGAALALGQPQRARRLLYGESWTTMHREVLRQGGLDGPDSVAFVVAEELARAVLQEGEAPPWEAWLRQAADDPARGPPERALALAGWGLSQMRSGRVEAAREALAEAGRRRLSALRDLQAQTLAIAPTVRWHDRLLLEFAVAATLASDRPDPDLVLATHVAFNRDIETSPDDALLLTVLQPTDGQRQISRALTLIGYRHQDWERARAADLAARLTTRSRGDGTAAVDRRAILAAGEAFVAERTRTRAGLANASSSEALGGLTSLAAVQSRLDEDEALILHLDALGGLVKLCVRKSGTVIASESVDGTQWAADVRAVSQALGATHPPSLEADSQYPVAEAIRLGQRLLGGLDACRASIRRLYVAQGLIPVFDGPPAALLAGPPAARGAGYDLRTAPWLVRDHAFVRVVGVPAFVAAKSGAGARRAPLDYLGVGDPVLSAKSGLPELPEASSELREVAALFSEGARRLLLRSEATGDSLARQPLADFDVVHFATHGLLREELPGVTEASLILSPGPAGEAQGDDGRLTATKIAALPLRARLAVLSACNSARYAPALQSEGVQGLAAGFALAGVPSAVASLWPVESGVTRDLIIDMFRAARPGRLPVADALAQAMRQHLARPGPRQLAHPRYWASLVVLGDGGVRLADDGAPDAARATAPPDGTTPLRPR